MAALLPGPTLALGDGSASREPTATSADAGLSRTIGEPLRPPSSGSARQARRRGVGDWSPATGKGSTMTSPTRLGASLVLAAVLGAVSVAAASPARAEQQTAYGTWALV